VIGQGRRSCNREEASHLNGRHERTVRYTENGKQAADKGEKRGEELSKSAKKKKVGSQKRATTRAWVASNHRGRGGRTGPALREEEHAMRMREKHTAGATEIRGGPAEARSSDEVDLEILEEHCGES
jgi:hypothetical protein